MWQRRILKQERDLDFPQPGFNILVLLCNDEMGEKVVSLNITSQERARDL